MNHNEKLDIVLGVFDKKIMPISFDEIANETKSNLNLKDLTLLNAILNKLIKDYYVESISINNININTHKESNEHKYRITFEGKMFIFDGGYAVDYENRNSHQIEINRIKNLQINLQQKLNLLTFWVTIGTLIAAVYYAIEVLKYFSVIRKTF